MGRPSLSCLLKTAIAGENLVTGSIVFLYDRMALWKLSLSNDPDMLQFDVMILFSCLTANSEPQLLCRFAMEDNLW